MVGEGTLNSSPPAGKTLLKERVSTHVFDELVRYGLIASVIMHYNSY